MKRFKNTKNKNIKCHMRRHHFYPIYLFIYLFTFQTECWEGLWPDRPVSCTFTHFQPLLLWWDHVGKSDNISVERGKCCNQSSFEGDLRFRPSSTVVLHLPKGSWSCCPWAQRNFTSLKTYFTFRVLISAVLFWLLFPSMNVWTGELLVGIILNELLLTHRCWLKVCVWATATLCT